MQKLYLIVPWNKCALSFMYVYISHLFSYTNDRESGKNSLPLHEIVINNSLSSSTAQLSVGILCPSSGPLSVDDETMYEHDGPIKANY